MKFMSDLKLLQAPAAAPLEVRDALGQARRTAVQVHAKAASPDVRLPRIQAVVLTLRNSFGVFWERIVSGGTERPRESERERERDIYIYTYIYI